MATTESYREFYQRAREIIGDKTPLKADCGILCDKRCCGGDESTGMLLFPHEETPFKVIEKQGVRLCVCGGECDRGSRPLACMIFPFFPYMDEEGRIRAVADVRGINVCPLISHKQEVLFDKTFLRRVARVGRLLKRDDECRQFLWETSREIDKINLFLNKI